MEQGDKIWMVASYSGGTPGDSDVDIFRTRENALKEFARRVKEAKDAFPDLEIMDEREENFYYDAGDVWEFITIEYRILE